MNKKLQVLLLFLMVVFVGVISTNQVLASQIIQTISLTPHN